MDDGSINGDGCTKTASAGVAATTTSDNDAVSERLPQEPQEPQGPQYKQEQQKQLEQQEQHEVAGTRKADKDTSAVASASHFRSRLVAYYQLHNSEKVEDVDKILAQFLGQEWKLFPALDRRYQTQEASTEEETRYAAALEDQRRTAADYEETEDRTIKLGLGDFVFYSVLVAKAAEFGFDAFASCFVVVLMGLGGTLVLLAVFHMALPALPISILLGVTCYFMVHTCMDPFLHDLMNEAVFV